MMNPPDISIVLVESGAPSAPNRRRNAFDDHSLPGPRFEVIVTEKNNPPLGYADRARGSLLVFLSSDMTVTHDYLQNISNKFKESPDTQMICGPVLRDPGRREVAQQVFRVEASTPQGNSSPITFELDIYASI